MTSEQPDSDDAERRQARINWLVEQAENLPPLTREEIERQRAQITVEDAKGNIDTY